MLLVISLSIKSTATFTAVLPSLLGENDALVTAVTSIALTPRLPPLYQGAGILFLASLIALLLSTSSSFIKALGSDCYKCKNHF